MGLSQHISTWEIEHPILLPGLELILELLIRIRGRKHSPHDDPRAWPVPPGDAQAIPELSAMEYVHAAITRKRGSVPVPAGVLDTYLNTAVTSSKEGTVAMTAYPAIASAGSLARKLRPGLEMPRCPGRSSTTGPAGVEPSPSALPREAFCMPWRSEDVRSSTVGEELEGKCDV